MDILRSFHLHMISDATGETLIASPRRCARNTRRCARSSTSTRWCAAAKQLERVVKDVEAEPGIVLYTLVDRELADELEKRCKRAQHPLRVGR